MARRIISISSSHRNDISTNDPVLNNDHPYLELGVIVGLGFTAVLAEGSQIDECKIHVDTFLRYRKFYFFDKINEISEAMTQIIVLSNHAFKKLGFPRYFDEFLWAIFLVTRDFYSLPKEIKKAIDDAFHQLFEKNSENIV